MLSVDSMLPSLLRGLLCPLALACARNLSPAVVDTSTGAFNQVHTRIRVQKYENYLKRFINRVKN